MLNSFHRFLIKLSSCRHILKVQDIGGRETINLAVPKIGFLTEKNVDSAVNFSGSPRSGRRRGFGARGCDAKWSAVLPCRSVALTLNAHTAEQPSLPPIRL